MNATRSLLVSFIPSITQLLQKVKNTEQEVGVNDLLNSLSLPGTSVLEIIALGKRLMASSNQLLEVAELVKQLEPVTMVRKRNYAAVGKVPKAKILQACSRPGRKPKLSVPKRYRQLLLDPETFKPKTNSNKPLFDGHRPKFLMVQHIGASATGYKCFVEKCSFPEQIDEDDFRRHLKSKHSNVDWHSICTACNGDVGLIYSRSILDEFEHLLTSHDHPDYLMDTVSAVREQPTRPEEVETERRVPVEAGALNVGCDEVTEALEEITVEALQELRVQTECALAEMEAQEEASAETVTTLPESTAVDEEMGPPPELEESTELIEMEVPTVEEEAEVQEIAIEVPVKAQKIIAPREKRVPAKVWSPTENELAQLVPELVSHYLRPWLDDDANKDPATVELMKNPKSSHRLFKCLEIRCTFSTEQSGEFESHLKKHAASDRGHKKCAYCKFEALDCASLITHIETEHGSDRFRCSFCWYRSCSIQNVFAHSLFYHNQMQPVAYQCQNMTEIDVNKKLIQLLSTRPDRRFPKLTFPFCQFSLSFKSMAELHKHLKSIPRTAKNFQCQKCSESIATQSMFEHFESCLGIGSMQCLYCSFGSSVVLKTRMHLADKHPSEWPIFCCREPNDDMAETFCLGKYPLKSFESIDGKVIVENHP